MIKVLFFIWTSLLLSGCVHLDEYIQINKNGSAKIVISYSMPVKDMTLLQDSEAVIAELNNSKEEVTVPRIFDEKKLRRHFEGIDGVEIISLRVNEETGRMITYFHLHVLDFRKALRDGLFPYTSLEKEKDNYVFAALYPFNLSKIKTDKKLKAALDAMKVAFKVKTPTVINETNGKKSLANLAEWSYSADGTPFTKSEGRFVVKFDSSQLTFLDEKKSE
ncbi:MAG: hypothetical protein NE327_05200 [Lentisphaeraceae bacterium]|nr:hypothetical protein [Lentisphaeraceae bacterium]